MLDSPLVRALQADPEGKSEWTAKRIIELADAAGLDMVGDIRAVATVPAVRVGRGLAKSPHFGRRVINGQTLWHLKP